MQQFIVTANDIKTVFFSMLLRDGRIPIELGSLKIIALEEIVIGKMYISLAI